MELLLRERTELVSGAIAFASIYAGNGSTCGITSAGIAYCWGLNNVGQLGDGTTATKTVPTAVSGSLVFASISNNYATTCGVTTTGVGYCWGSNVYYTIGDGTNANKSIPTAVSGGLTFSSIDTSNASTCGITTGAVTYCWGANGNSQVGDGTTTTRSTPVPVTGTVTFSVLSSGILSVCGLGSGAVYCWGQNNSMQLGAGSAAAATAATPLALPGNNWAGAAAGVTGSCSVTTTGQAYCWGNNAYGQLGDGSLSSQKVINPVTPGQNFATIYGSNSKLFTSALTTGGAGYCWGYNASGQLGDGTTTGRYVPTAVSGGYAFTAMTQGANHACGLTSAGAAYCWGQNTAGQVGDSTYVDKTAGPVLVSGGLTFSSLSAGATHTCGLTTAGTAYCWGLNSNYQLGDNTTAARSSPTLVSGGLTFSSISAGTYNTCAVTSAGAGYCWGNNATGQVGDNTTVTRTAPAAVSGGLTFSMITPGGDHTCGVTTSKTGYCWGYNGSGRLGDGTTTTRLTPSLIVGSHVFSSVVPSSQTTCGTETNGLAFCWGNNTFGQLGNGTVTDVSVPTVAVASTTSNSANLNSAYTYASNKQYTWGFSPSATKTLSRVTTGVAGNTSATATHYLSLPGSGTNEAKTPDTALNSVTGDIDIRSDANISWTSGSTQNLVTKLGAGGSRSYALSISTLGKVSFTWSQDGTTQISRTSTVAVPFSNNTRGRVRATFVVNNAGNNVADFYTSTDGTSWTALGTSISTAGATSIFDGASNLEIGGSSGSATVLGKIYYASVRNSITGTTTSPSGCASSGVVSCFDPSAAYTARWVTVAGEAWTIVRSASNPADLEAPLTVSSVSGIPSGGSAVLRMIDGVAVYSFSATSVSATTPCTLALSGFINANSAGPYISPIVTYDSAATPMSAEVGLPSYTLLRGNNVAPNALAQYRSDGTTSIATGGYNTVNSTVVFKAYITDPNTDDTDNICVELRPIATAFTGVDTSCSTGFAPATTASLTISGLTEGTQYHWQLRTKDNNGQYSPWADFGANGAARDFGIDTIAPTAGSVVVSSDGSLSSLSGVASGFSDNGSGIASYDYQIGTTQGGSEIQSWTNSGSASSTVTATALSLRTTLGYYVTLRAIDGAGLVSGTVSSAVGTVAPTLSQSVSTATVSFGHLAPGQLGTATVTLTTSTNAYSGYKVYGSLLGRISGPNGATISNFNGGTYALPDTFLAGDNGFGYTSSDTLVGGANLYQSQLVLAGQPLAERVVTRLSLPRDLEIWSPIMLAPQRRKLSLSQSP